MIKPTHHCPACGEPSLELHQTADGLKTNRCPGCGGMWVRGNEYLDWLSSKNPVTQKPVADSGLWDEPATDSKAGKLCLDCGRLIRRVRVGHGLDFHLDRCGTCGGFWFDAAEWDRLAKSGLNREAHLVFTDAWQAEVRRQIKADADRSRREDRLGPEAAARVEELRAWIATHPNGEEILARLIENDTD